MHSRFLHKMEGNARLDTVPLCSACNHAADVPVPEHDMEALVTLRLGSR